MRVLFSTLILACALALFFPLSFPTAEVEIKHTLQKDGSTERKDIYANLPHGKMFRNVQDFGARGDGVTDDTSAFIRALDYNVGLKHNKLHGTVYVPRGTYRITDTLILWNGTHLVGDRQSRPTLFLPPGTPGFENPDRPKPLIVTANGYNIDPKTRDWQTRNSEKGGSTNNTFYISLSHINLRIEGGNPGTVGIYWLVAQATAIRDIEIDAVDAVACIKSSLWGGGGVIANIKVRGGRVGWAVDQTSQWLVRSADFSGQKQCAINLKDIWSFVFIDLNISDCASGLNIEGEHGVCVIDSSFRNVLDGVAITSNVPQLFLQNVKTEGLREVVRGNLPTSENGSYTVSRWIWGKVYKNGEKRVGIFDIGPAPERLPSPEFPSMSQNIKSVTEFGVIPDDNKDDTLSLQSAIDQWNDLYFPAGEYLVSDTLRLRSHTKLYGEHCALILLDASKGFANRTDPKPMIETPDDPQSTVTIVNISLSITNQVGGAYFLEWRSGENSKIMDVYIHDACQQPFIWRISGSGGGFFENLWWPYDCGIGGKGVIITSSHRKWFYSCQHEHFPRGAVILENARNAVFALVQFEDDYPASMIIDHSEDITVYGFSSSNWGVSRPAAIQISGSKKIAVFNMNWIGAHHAVMEKEDIISKRWPKTKPNTSDRQSIMGWIKE